MNMRIALCAAIITILTGCASREVISYRQDVLPILEHNCLECHLPPDGKGYLKTRLNMESYDTLMQGTLYGPVVVPGDSRHSILNMLVEGRAEATLRMPHEREQPITKREIEILRLWVDQGARDN